jgi:hypothetical protein
MNRKGLMTLEITISGMKKFKFTLLESSFPFFKMQHTPFRVVCHNLVTNTEVKNILNNSKVFLKSVIKYG